MAMLATTDEREARAALRAFGQLLPGMAALYQTLDGVWMVDPQQHWDKDATTKRGLPDPYAPSLVDPTTGALMVELQRRSPWLVAIRGEGYKAAWRTTAVADPDDPWAQPLPPVRERFVKPTPADVSRPVVPPVARSGEPIAKVEYTKPSDSSRRTVQPIFIDHSLAAWIGVRPDEAVAAARAVATRVGMEVAIWREDSGDYWLFPIYGRDQHLPLQVIDAPNGVLRTSHEQLQAIVGAGTAFDPHGLIAFNGADDPEFGDDSYLKPSDPRLDF